MNTRRNSSLLTVVLGIMATACGGSVIQPKYLVAPPSSADAVLQDNEAQYGPSKCEAFRSVVSVSTSSGPFGEWVGSGFAIGDGSHVIVAYHSIDEDEGNLAVTALECDSDAKPTYGETFAARVVATSAHHDVALLQLEEGHIRPMPRAKEIAKRGDNVRLFGLKTLGLEGTVTNIREVSGPVARGDSGGAVVNARGEVIGIATKAVCGENCIDYRCDNIAQANNTFLGYEYVPIAIALATLVTQ